MKQPLGRPPQPHQIVGDLSPGSTAVLPAAKPAEKKGNIQHILTVHEDEETMLGIDAAFREAFPDAITHGAKRFPLALELAKFNRPNLIVVDRGSLSGNTDAQVEALRDASTGAPKVLLICREAKLPEDFLQQTGFSSMTAKETLEAALAAKFNLKPKDGLVFVPKGNSIDPQVLVAKAWEMLGGSKHKV